MAGALGLDEDDVEDRLERLEREHAIVRFVSEGETMDRALTLRYRFAHHVYQKAFYESLRVTRRASYAKAIANQLVSRLTGGTVRMRRRHRPAVRDRARERQGRGILQSRRAGGGAALRARRDRAARAARPEPAGLGATRAGAECGGAVAADDLRPRAEDQPRLRRFLKSVPPTRARAICAARWRIPHASFPSSSASRRITSSSGEIETSRDVALEMLDLFNRLGDPNLQMLGEWSLGAALFHLGELHVAHDHLERGLALYDPAFHRPRVWETGIDPGVFCRCELSRTLLLRGYPDQGLAMALEAVAQARAIEHPQPLRVRAAVSDHRAPRAPRPGCRRSRPTRSSRRSAARTASRRRGQWAGPLRGRALVEIGEIDRGTAGDGGDARRAHADAVCAAASVLSRAVCRRADARGSASPRRRTR